MLSSVWALVRSLTNRVRSALRFLFALLSSEFTIVVDQQCGLSCNEVYEAAEIYLRPKITPSTKRCRVYKTSRQKNINTRMDPNSVIIDTYDGCHLKWKLVSIKTMHGEQRFFELSFNNKFMEKVHNDYLPFVLAKSKEIKDNNKVVKLYTTNCPTYDDDEGGRARGWGSINLEHPFTFETLAMEVEMKNAIVEDLKRFVRRKEYYKKVGKAWKRGYLLYGPPGTGKSSLIAAMANYLKFDIYDVELTTLRSNSDFRRTLVSTTNRSIIVIEDIDCSPETQDRELQRRRIPNPDWTLSGLLNFMDGLWSSCGDERVIVFTTNHKDRLDPALLRPGRMDMHIHMSYCTSHGFRTLASTYLGIDIDQHHPLFGEIEGLIEKVKVTPAEIAGELMKSEDADIALAGLVDFLQHKMEVKSDTKEGEKTNITLQCNDVKEEAKKVEKGGTEEENLLYKPSIGHSWRSPSSIGMPSVASQFNYELGGN